MQGGQAIAQILQSEGVKHVFCSSSDAVRDVQFNPHQPFEFAAALESGMTVMDIS